MASSGWQAWNGLYTSSFGYNYFKCSIRIDSISHSGNTVTISGAFGVLNDGGYESYYVYPINARIRDVTNYQQVVAGNQHITTNNTVTSGVSFSLSVPASNTSASFTIDWLYNNGTASNAYTYTVNFDASYVAPNTPTVSISSITVNSVAVTYGTSSYGNPSTGTTYLYGGTSSSPTTQITSKTTTGNSTYTNSSLASNTKYYYRSRAGNGQLNSSYSSEKTAVTLASSPTVTVGSVSGNSATIDYSTVADGGFYDKTIQYSTDGGTTWQTGATVTGGSAQSGSFTIDNLPSGENAVLVRTNTTSGADSPITVTITIQTNGKLYGSVGELTNLTGVIRSGGSGNISSFDGATFLAKMKSMSQTEGFEFADDEYGELDYLRVFVTGGPYYMIQFHTKNGKTRSNGYGMGASGLAGWGITAIDVSSASGSDYIDLTTNYAHKSKRIVKLYGSVNGQTKRIIKMYGSVNGQSKVVFNDES